MPGLGADWDDEARRFDESPDHGLRDPEVLDAWRRLLDWCLPPSPTRITDLGCGTGSLSVLLSGAGHEVTGIDRSPAMLAIATQKAVRPGRPAARFALGDAATPPLRRRAFGAVLCRHVLWTLPDPRAAIEGWARLLVGGGRLVVIEGRWSTGAGLGAAEVESLLAPHCSDVVVRQLTDPALWGREIDDERFAVRARKRVGGERPSTGRS